MLWEVFALGETPYASMTSIEAALAVGSGYRLPAPALCPPPLYDMLQSMWAVDVQARPPITAIHAELQAWLDGESVSGAADHASEPVSPVSRGPAYLQPDNEYTPDPLFGADDSWDNAYLDSEFIVATSAARSRHRATDALFDTELERLTDSSA